MPATDDIRRVAEERFGWARLRDEQVEAMEHVLTGHDVLAVLPTGAGKSAIYQVPAVLLDGPTLVVPLIALQHDQIDGIEDSLDSLDSYYQQIGRAGRDGEPAEITLCYRPEDLALQNFLTTDKPPADTVEAVARALREHSGPLTPAELAERVDAGQARRTRAINLLEQADVLTADAAGRLRYADPRATPEQAVEAALAAAEGHQRLVRSRLAMLRGYAETTGCRRQYLLGYFGEELDRPCGNCDTCDAGTAQPQTPGTGEFPRDSSVHHTEWGHGVVMSVEPDRMTVLFDDEGYKTLSLDAVRDNNLLTADED